MYVVVIVVVKLFSFSSVLQEFLVKKVVVVVVLFVFEDKLVIVFEVENFRDSFVLFLIQFFLDFLFLEVFGFFLF